ncbi:MAG: mechanosensitive ion channel family protein [Candidatus Ratteibacteria bacterium]
MTLTAVGFIIYSMEKIGTEYFNKFLLYLPKIPLALVIVLAGWFLGKTWNRFYLKISKNSRIDALARKYIARLVYMAIFAFSIIIALSTLGLNISPFLAGIGAGGLIIGFGVRETVADFAAGIMIFIYRPFKIGDLVKICGVEGEVVAISPVNIELKAKDSRKVLVPNRSAWGQIIYNSTKDGKNICALQITVSQETTNLDEILNPVFQQFNIKYRCCLMGILPSGLNYTIYVEIPKDMSVELDQIIKNLWVRLQEKNINATITLQS